MNKEIDYDTLLDKMHKNINKNVKYLKKNFKQEQYNGIFQVIFDYVKFNDYTDKSILLLETLLECGLDPNTMWHDENYPNFLFRVVKSFNVSKKQLLKIIDLGIKYKVDLNAVDINGSTIMFSLIYNQHYRKMGVSSIFNLLVDNGYDLFICHGTTPLNLHYIYCSSTIDRENDHFLEIFHKRRIELFNKKIDDVINNITKDNLNEIEQYKGYLSIFECEKYDSEISFEIIKRLFEKGLNPNQIINDNNQNIMYHLSNSKYSCNSILEILKMAYKSKLDINHQDNQGNTILHHYLLNNSLFVVIHIYEFLIENGFDPTIRNNNKQTIIDLVKASSYYPRDKEKFIKKYSDYNVTSFFENNSELKGLGELIDCYSFENSKYLINNDNYPNNKLFILIGKDKVGKTTTLKNIANHLSSEDNKVFLTSADKIINNCVSVGNAREILMLIIEKCSENNTILLIDDLDKLYNSNNSKFDKKNISIIINYYLNNSTIRMIATINERNKKILNSEPLKKPHVGSYSIDFKENNLRLIIEDILKKYNCDIDNNLLNIIKEILIIVSKENNIVNSDTISNVMVINSIIEDLFKDKNNIDINHLIYCIRINQYIKEDIKNIVINELNNLNKNYIDKDIKKLIKNINK